MLSPSRHLPWVKLHAAASSFTSETTSILLLIYSTFLNHSSSQQICVLSDDDTGKMSKGHAIRTSHFKLWSEINYAAHMPQLISLISELECQNAGENLNQDCQRLQDEVFEKLTFATSYRKKVL